MPKVTIKTMLRQGIYFMAIGPLIGLSIILFFIVVFTIKEVNVFDFNEIQTAINSTFIAIFVGFFVAYFIGAIPAFLSGCVSSLGNTKRQQTTYAVLVGGFICSFISVVLFKDWNISNTQTLWWNALLGWVFGGFCAFLCIIKRHKSNLNL